MRPSDSKFLLVVKGDKVNQSECGISQVQPIRMQDEVKEHICLCWVNSFMPGVSCENCCLLLGHLNKTIRLEHVFAKYE